MRFAASLRTKYRDGHRGGLLPVKEALDAAEALKLEGTMQTASGRAEAVHRTLYLRGFINHLAGEIGR